MLKLIAVLALAYTVSAQDIVTDSTTTTSSLLSEGTQSGNATQTAAVTQFFGQVLRGQMLGLRKCKKPKDCGLGLRCDLLLNLCVPFNTPILSDIEKQCTNHTECSAMHMCQGGFCRFCGPKSCRSNFDCCTGSFAQPGQPARFFECTNLENLEKQALAAQLGRPTINTILAGGKSPEDAIESDELLQLGIGNIGDQVMYGKRCWARCNVDNDCYSANTPDDIRKNLGCCNGVCSRRQSCVTVPQSAILLQQQQQQLAAQQLAQQQLLAQQQQALGQGTAASQSGGWGTRGHHLGSQLPQQPILMGQQQAAPLTWAEAQQGRTQAGQQG